MPPIRETPERLKSYIDTQVKLFETIETFSKTKLKTANLSYCTRYLAKLNDSYAYLMKLQYSLETVSDIATVDVDFRTKYEELYLELCCLFDSRIEDLKNSGTKNEEAPQPVIAPKLPNIELDSFAGEITKWPEFINSFDALVHTNSKLSSIAKFQYLRTSVTGLAKTIIENLDFTSTNYDVARNLLIDRFENKKVICEEHIKALFNYKALDKPCHSKLSELLSNFNSHIRSLHNQERPTEHWDDLLVYLMSSKFDTETHLKWIDAAPSDRIATYKEISNFIKTRCMKLETQSTVSQKFMQNKPTYSQSPTNKPKLAHSFHTNESKTYSCSHCNVSGHSILRCAKFKALSIMDRRAAVEQNSLCFNCLRAGHTSSTCPSPDTCHVCQRKHHTMIHRDATSSTPLPPPTTTFNSSSSTIQPPQISNNSSASATSISLPSVFKSSYILLATAMVEVFDKFGTPHVARALLDSGSQINFVSEALASRLGLNCVENMEEFGGIGSSKQSSALSTNFIINSMHGNYSAMIDCLVLSKLTDDQPSLQIDVSKLCIPGNIQLADPYFYLPQSIDILLGAQLYFDLLLVGQIKISPNLPILQKTQLGWVIAGEISTNSPRTSLICNCVTSACLSPTLADQVQKFWKLDTTPDHQQIDPIANHVAERHFRSTFSKDSTGRFIVQLPFNTSPLQLGDSAMAAKRRFLNLERRLRRNPELESQYKHFMDEYLELGHMEKVADEKIEASNFYLPHHCIVKPDSSTTRLRVVFDGSAQSSSGKSLNDVLTVGPVVQSELHYILCRFRSHCYAFGADISKMYRQIWVSDEDCKYQYIFWRNKSSEPISTYKLKTVTYGTSAAPFLATRCLMQLSIDYEHDYPTASNSIRHDIYVDDLLSGANTLKKAVAIRSDIVKILQSASLDLRKWCSNSDDVIEDIPNEHHEKLRYFDDGEFVKTLGILWQPSTDVLQFKVDLPTDQKITKRVILSEVARIFDPIGLLSPVVVLGKLFVQRLWQLNSSWDESLPMSMHTEWNQFRSAVKELSSIAIPRHLFAGEENPSEIQLHCFGDASESAYGVAIYTRFRKMDGTFVVRLLCSKSRVAPLRKVTLARLELCASLLLAQTVNGLHKNLNFPISQTFCWSDSKIVLSWINGCPSNWNTFVGNRVSSIKNSLIKKLGFTLTEIKIQQT